jgi:DNA-binding CsgD family transcriptional regulator
MPRWRDELGYGPLVVPELAEAASRSGDLELVGAALQWLSERSRLAPTQWALGIQARVRALLSEGDTAQRHYRQSIARLRRTPVRVQLARAQLLYGEWLRRQRRRLDARAQLGTAYAMLDAMGIQGFAERARRELQATGATARKRTVETREELTAQEAVIARLAREGLSNPELGSRLFISARTVQSHLGKVFAKLAISSRGQLHQVLANDPARATAQEPAGSLGRGRGAARPGPVSGSARWRMRTPTTGGCERRPAPTRLGGPCARCDAALQPQGSGRRSS